MGKSKQERQETLERYEELIAEGYKKRDIARELGVNPRQVRRYCRRHGLGQSEALTGGTYIIPYVTGDSAPFTYIGGYVNAKGKVDLRCNTCGAVFTFSVENFRTAARRGREVCCPACKEKEAEEKRNQHEKIRQANRERNRECRERQTLIRQLCRLLKKKIKEETKMTCPACGKEFVSHRGQKYCSHACARRAYEKDHPREKRFDADKIIDKDISLKKLYDRDKGKCWLCGELCNLDDYEVVDGTVICGDEYPSIDHVVPRAKGGEHSWENVRLAHRGCNRIKGDTIL